MYHGALLRGYSSYNKLIATPEQSHKTEKTSADLTLNLAVGQEVIIQGDAVTSY